MKRVRDFKVRDIFEIHTSSISNRRVKQNGWVKVRLVDDQAGEYIVTSLDDNTRVALDGYETAREV